MAIVKCGTLEGVDYTKLLNKKNPTIVQIGAHDGILGEEYGLQETLDELDNFRLILVEPIEKWFLNLKSVYSKYEDKVEYLMVAISEKNGSIKMVDHGCMSRIDNNGSIDVESITWDTFIEKYNIENIDLLLLDCEGYEFQILNSINFSKQKISLIRYEFYHIPNKEECDNYLIKNGYNIDLCHYDSISNKIAYLKYLK